MIKPLISSSESSKDTGNTDVPLSQLDSPKKDKLDDDEEKPKKIPSKDSPIRWASFVVYIAISTPLMVALIGFAAGFQP